MSDKIDAALIAIDDAIDAVKEQREALISAVDERVKALEDLRDSADTLATAAAVLVDRWFRGDTVTEADKRALEEAADWYEAERGSRDATP